MKEIKERNAGTEEYIWIRRNSGTVNTFAGGKDAGTIPYRSSGRRKK